MSAFSTRLHVHQVKIQLPTSRHSRSLVTHGVLCEDSDQTVRMHRIMCVFAGRTCILIGNAVLRFIFSLTSHEFSSTRITAQKRRVGPQTLWQLRPKDFKLVDLCLMLWLWSGPPESNCWFSFVSAFQFFLAVESSLYVHRCIRLVFLFSEMLHWWVRNPSRELNKCLVYITAELRARVVAT